MAWVVSGVQFRRNVFQQGEKGVSCSWGWWGWLQDEALSVEFFGDKLISYHFVKLRGFDGVRYWEKWIIWRFSCHSLFTPNIVPLEIAITNSSKLEEQLAVFEGRQTARSPALKQRTEYDIECYVRWAIPMVLKLLTPWMVVAKESLLIRFLTSSQMIS